MSRQKRASSDDSQAKPAKTASDIKLLTKEELRLLQNQICAKDEKLCRPLEGGEDEDPKEYRAPEGNPAQQELLVNMDQ